MCKCLHNSTRRDTKVGSEPFLLFVSLVDHTTLPRSLVQNKRSTDAGRYNSAVFNTTLHVCMDITPTYSHTAIKRYALTTH
jgi:hypothetical protein